MAFWDSVTERMNEMGSGRQQKKSAEMFKAQMEYLDRKKTFTLKDFVEMMADLKKQSGVEGWGKMLRTKEQQQQMEEMMTDAKIGEYLLPQEIKKPSLVGRRERLRIASEAGVDLPKVNVFFRNFEQMTAVHRWVQRRKGEGHATPTTMDDFLRVSATDSKGLGGGAAARRGKGRGRLGTSGAMTW